MGDVRPEFPVTARQLEVLRTVASYRDQHGFPPTLRELSALIGNASTNGTAQVLRALKRRELVAWVPRRHGTLRLTLAGWDVLEAAGRSDRGGAE